MKSFFYKVALLAVLFNTSCTTEPKSWKYHQLISVEGVNPIGIVKTEDGLWLSDGDHNRLVLIDDQGNILKEVTGFDRPMHIDQKDNVLYVPEYGRDQIVTLEDNEKNNYQIDDSLDAPAAIALYEDEVAIVDFYKHRILYNDGSKWTSFGKEGKAKKYFYFPYNKVFAVSCLCV